jgi:hypothetical protein
MLNILAILVCRGKETDSAVDSRLDDISNGILGIKYNRGCDVGNSINICTLENDWRRDGYKPSIGLNRQRRHRQYL